MFSADPTQRSNLCSGKEPIDVSRYLAMMSRAVLDMVQKYGAVPRAGMVPWVLVATRSRNSIPPFPAVESRKPILDIPFGHKDDRVVIDLGERVDDAL